MANTIVWFRNCLRLHDNVALMEASKLSDKVVCIFIFTPSVYSPEFMGLNRFYFLLQSLQDLKTQLKSRYNGDLVLIETKTTYIDALTKIAKESTIKKIFYEYDSTPYAKRRDRSIKEHLQKEHPKIEFTSFQGHTLTDLAKVTSQSGFKYPINMNMMEKIMLKEFGNGKSRSGFNVSSPLDLPLEIKFNSSFADEIEHS